MLKSLVLAVSTEWDLGFGAPWGRTSVSETKRKGEGLTERTRCMQFREGVGSKGCGEVGCFEKETGMEMSWRCHGWHGMVHYFRCPFLAFLPKIAVRLAPRRPKHAPPSIRGNKGHWARKYWPFGALRSEIPPGDTGFAKKSPASTASVGANSRSAPGDPTLRFY